MRVRYATRDGSAVSGSEPTGGCDYERASGELIFAPNTSAAEIVVRVYEDDVVEAEEQFFVDLAPSPGCPVDIPRPSVVVVIMDSTQPGRLMFSEPVREVTGTARVAMVPVARKQGADGRASVKFRTADADAVAGAPLAPSMVVWTLLCVCDRIALHHGLGDSASRLPCG